MRRIDHIVVHCSATREGQHLPPEILDWMHRARGFSGTGYHYYIRRSGAVHNARPIAQIGAHTRGYNHHSIGICYEGGLDARGNPTDTRTPEQRAVHPRATCRAPSAGGTAQAEVPRRKGMRTPRPESRHRRRRSGGTPRMAQAMSLLRGGDGTVNKIIKPKRKEKL